MIDRFSITITEVTGCRHFYFHNVVKVILKYLVMISIMVLAIGLGVILLLNQNVMDLEAKKEMISRKLSFLARENNNLVSDMTSKSKELNEIDEKIVSIEQRLGIDATPDMSLAERMELANMIISRREEEYQALGDRLENVEGIIGVDKPGRQENRSLLDRVDVASLTASQKMVMLEAIPSGYPLANNELSSGFGFRSHPTMKKRAFHGGYDLRTKMNTPVFVTAHGLVEYAGHHQASGFGTMVTVRHNFGFISIYGHLSKVEVEVGDFVRKGDLIGQSGNSGMSSGPHLHYEIRFLQASLDPSNFVAWGIDNYEAVFQEKQVKWASLVNLVNQRLTSQAPPLLRLAQK